MAKATIFLSSLCIALGAIGRAQAPLVTSTITDPDGHTRLLVQNLSSSALTACAYVAQMHSMTADGQISPEIIQERVLSDSALNLSGPILPNQTKTFNISGWNAQVTLTAVLWADGNSFGDPVWIQKLLQRRALARKHVDLALSIVEEAKQSGSSLAEAAGREEAAKAQADQDSNDQDVVPGLKMYYNQVLMRLTGPGLKHSTGQTFTDAETMDQAIRELENYKQHMSLY